MRIYSKNYLNPCSIEGCDRLVYCKGACKKHYARYLKHGDYVSHALRAKPKGKCRIKDCEFIERSRGYCARHYERVRKTGSAMKVSSNGRKAERAEINATMLLRLMGYSVSRIKHQQDGDLLVDGYTVEVKCATPIQSKSGTIWQFNIHRHGKLNERCDYYIFRFEKVPGFKNAVHAAFKAPIGVSTKTFSLRSMISNLAPAVELFKNFPKRLDRQPNE